MKDQVNLVAKNADRESVDYRRLEECPECGSDQIDIDCHDMFCQDCQHFELQPFQN